MHDYCHIVEKRLEDEIASLKSKLAEAQKDRERLDWLLKFGVQNTVTRLYARTREDVDAAMEAEKNG